MMKPLRFLLLICMMQSLGAIAQDESEIIKCQKIGEKVVKITSGAQKISNIDRLVTWRASCAEKPPVGAGNVAALCEGDLVSKNGTLRRIFYWQNNKANGEENIGYHLCPQTSSQTSNPVNLFLGNNFCEKVKNSAQLIELARRVKMQADQDNDGSTYSIDTNDRIIARFIFERHQNIKEKNLLIPRLPMKFIDMNLFLHFNKTIDECLVSIHDSDLIYLFARGQLRVDEIRKRIKFVLEERRPITNRRIDSAGNVVFESIKNNIQPNVHRSCDYSTDFCQTENNELNIAWLIALDAQGNIFKNLYPELISSNFILKGTSNSSRRGFQNLGNP